MFLKRSAIPLTILLLVGCGGDSDITDPAPPVTPPPVTPPPPNPVEAERAALVALYEATNGPSWVSSENWLTDAPLGEWYGVETDASGRVVGLDLSGSWDSEAEQSIVHGLSGPIPPELGTLTNLTVLDLGYNLLSGPIPPDLRNLINLSSLNLRRNLLTGPVPPGFGDLRMLERLDLVSNSLSGAIPPELGTHLPV